jgi:hypothetical protein
MAGGGSKPGERRGGRQKGTPNKTTKAAKDAIAAAADELGGVARLVEWAREDKQNERIFWGTIYPKLLPLQVAGDQSNPVHTVNEIILRGVRPDPPFEARPG